MTADICSVHDADTKALLGTGFALSHGITLSAGHIARQVPDKARFLLRWYRTSDEELADSDFRSYGPRGGVDLLVMRTTEASGARHNCIDYFELAWEPSRPCRVLGTNSGVAPVGISLEFEAHDLAPSGLGQISPRPHLRHEISSGFSGAPVFDEVLGGFLGLVTGFAKVGDAHIGYVMRSQVVLGQLPEHVRSSISFVPRALSNAYAEHALAISRKRACEDRVVKAIERMRSRVTDATTRYWLNFIVRQMGTPYAAEAVERLLAEEQDEFARSALTE